MVVHTRVCGAWCLASGAALLAVAQLYGPVRHGGSRLWLRENAVPVTVLLPAGVLTLVMAEELATRVDAARDVGDVQDTLRYLGFALLLLAGSCAVLGGWHALAFRGAATAHAEHVDQLLLRVANRKR